MGMGQVVQVQKRGRNWLSRFGGKVFNQAMLANQVWCLIQKPNSLAGEIIKGRYFPDHDIMQARIGNNPSFIWRGLLWGRELLKLGIRWRIRDGSSVKVFDDPWMPRPSTFKPITAPSESKRN